MPAPEPSVETHPKADDIVQYVESAIITGELAPGALLRQEHLAASFRVSRTPVREALRRLHAAGLVSLVPHRGARVRGVSLEDLRESAAVRAELEGLAAELAAQRIDDVQLRALRREEKRFARTCAEFLRATSDGKRENIRLALVSANDQFHDAILTASGSQLITTMVERVRLPFTVYLSEAWEDGGQSELLTGNIRQHRSIRELIEMRSPTAARAVMREHVLVSGQLLEGLADRASGRPAANLIKRLHADPFWLRGGE